MHNMHNVYYGNMSTLTMLIKRYHSLAMYIFESASATIAVCKMITYFSSLEIYTVASNTVLISI